MEMNPIGQEARPDEPSRKTWKNYIGWAAFVVTAGILVQQIILHCDSAWYFCFGEGTRMIAGLGDPSYSLLYHITTVFEAARAVFFTLYPLIILIMLLLRKKAVPRLLVIFAAVAICTNVAAEVLYNMLAVEYGHAVQVDLLSIAYLVIDIALVWFYTKSARFKVLFSR